MKTRTERLTLWWLPPAFAALLLAAPLPASFVEFAYSRGIYRAIQGTLTTLSNLAPFAWLDAFVIAAIVVAGWRTTRLLRERRQRGWLRTATEAGQRVLRAAGVLVVIFLALWGFNYRRVPMADMLPRSDAPPPSAADLRLVLLDANALAARLRPSAVAQPWTYDEIADRLRDPFNHALSDLGRPALIAFGRPKFSLITPYFTWAGINGMVDPYALESIVHPDALPFERPFILAHEWGHLAGQADEAEASAVGWLACLRGDPPLAYSGVVYLVVELSNALPPRLWRETVPSLDPGLVADLQAQNARWARSQPLVRHAASRVYDRYLRANGVDDGVASYSRALSLILRAPLRDAITAYPADRGRPR